MIRKYQIIVCDKGDVPTRGLPECDVAIGVPESRRLWQVEPANAGIAKAGDDGCGVVGAGVTDDQQLEIRLCLIEDTRNR